MADEKKHDDKPKRSRRIERREERRAMAKKLTDVRRVRVSPTNEEFRKSMAHPRLGGFRSKGSIEWPLDNWTKRRIREGSIKIDSAEQTQARQQSRQETRQEARQAGGSRAAGGASGGTPTTGV